MRRTARSKILAPARLEVRLRKLRRGARGPRRAAPRVVFTNGCFDLMHVGHVTYLEKARACGDLLVVALDTDASVRALKGPGRPVNPLKARMRVMAALECVDFVTFFSGSDPRPLIRRLRPQVLVKGGDWKPEAILGAREVWADGGEVKSIALVKGYSTTRTVARVRGR